MKSILLLVVLFVSSSVFASPVFTINATGLSSEIVQGYNTAVDIEITNNSRYETDLIVTAGFSGDGKIIDNSTCIKTKSKSKCALTLNVIPKKTGGTEFTIEVAGFSGLYASNYSKKVDVKGSGIGDLNIYVSHASTYPRSVITGLIAANSNHENEQFDLYYWKAPVDEEIAKNVMVKGAVPLQAEPVDGKTVEDSGCDQGGCEPDPNNPLQELEEISNLVMAAKEGQLVNLVIEETFVRRSTKLMYPEALARTKSIKIILEGSGSIVPNNRLDNTLLLAEQAEKNGVKDFRIQIFDSMDLNVLAKTHEQWANVINDHYIGLLPISFSKLATEIETGYETDVLGKLISGYGYDLKTAFVKPETYDENKKLLVYFGSARNEFQNSAQSQQGGDYNNMMMIDSYLSKPEITNTYNIAIKPHPKLAWINSYISDNSINASYFSSMPYELIAVAGGKEIDGLTIPIIDRVDSTYSTILFSVDTKQINSIIDYSPNTGYNSSSDTAEYMKEHYALLPGWGLDTYEQYAKELREQLGAPHMKVTNVYNFVNNLSP